jgi:nucleoside-triphosphatase THEP1
MELFCPRFITAVQAAISSPKKVLGTISLKPHPLADTIRQNRNIMVTELTRSNQGPVLAQMMAWLS